MPTYVMDDGCVFNTIKRAIEKTISSEEVSEYEEKISGIHTFLNTEFKKSIYISDDYINFKIENDYIYNHLTSRDNIDYRDAFLSLFMTLERLTKFDSESCVNYDIFEIDDFFASSFIQEKYSGFISSRTINNETWWNNDLHHTVNNICDSVDIFKSKIIIDHLDYNFAFNYKHLFWPNCYFHIGTTNRFNNLSVSEAQYLPLLFKHLDFLDQEAKALYKLYPEPSRFIAEANAQGIDLSPESPKTHGNTKAMSERNIIVDESPILCEWHTKLTPTEGRVHFNLNLNEPEKISETVKGRVIIGIYAEHLTT